MSEKDDVNERLSQAVKKITDVFDGPDQRTTLRVPDWLHKTLVSKAESEHRSLNEQIIHMLMRGLSYGDEKALHEAAKRVWVAALPDKDQPGRYLVSAKAIDHLGDVINEYERL